MTEGVPYGTAQSRVCSVDGCGGSGYLTRGWCKRHYARWRRHGELGGHEKQHAVSWAGATCQHNGCSSPVNSVGYCNAHYKRLRKWGDASIKNPTTPAEERFWAKVDKRGPDECWPWTAGTSPQGYGGFHPKKTETITAHRYSFELAFGPPEPGDVIDHACHNGAGCPPGPCEHRLCCNPAHLEATSNADNVNRSHNSNVQKTHCPRGHEYTHENTIYQRKLNTTSRKCRACSQERDRRRRSTKEA